VDESDFTLIQKLMRDRAGIYLDSQKHYLVDARLEALARRERLPSVSELCARLRSSTGDTLRRKVLDVMVTTETSFFRDVAPFQALRQSILPDLLGRRLPTKQLTIWSGASSSGQEIYSVALMIREQFGGLPGWDVRLIASDLSRDMLARAREGRYSQLEVNRGLPAPLLAKYFEKDGLEWRITERIRSMVEFRELNLLESWGALRPPDVVLLRNVLIYFADDAKRTVLGRLRTAMPSDGYLFLGAAETTYGLDGNYRREMIQSAVCYRPTAPGRTA
jgi:chemotaxis protein methyltransferase CheR